MERYKHIRDMLIDIYSEIISESAEAVSSDSIRQHILKIGYRFMDQMNEKELDSEVCYLNQIELIAHICAKHALLLKEKKDGKLG